jgi:hypothetical protein
MTEGGTMLAQQQDLTLSSRGKKYRFYSEKLVRSLSLFYSAVFFLSIFEIIFCALV